LRGRGEIEASTDRRSSEMAQIIVTAERGPEGSEVTEVHRERIVPADFESDAASSLLIERIGWALSDADTIEHRREDWGHRSSASTAG
jgi:hypothetical protein